MGGPAEDRIDGIAEPLPPGERLLWQGRPALGSLLREAFHVRVLAVYFVALALAPVVMSWGGAAPTGIPVAAQVAWLLLLGGAAVGLMVLMAWLTARSTIYAITSRRVVMRIGVALPAVLNLPLTKVGGLWQRVHGDGTGDLALTPRETRSIGYLFLWPHARPWRVASPEPMLRSIPGVENVGAILRDAVLAGGALERPEGAPSPVAWDLTGEADDPCGGHLSVQSHRLEPRAAS
jgi:hypothetical protein